MDNGHESKCGTIEATGEGSVKVRPDVAQMRLGAVTQAKTAREAAAENAVIAQRVIEAVRAVGIDEASIETVGLGLDAVYEWNEAEKRNELVGYRATNTVVVRAPVAAAAAVYDAGIGAGAGEAGGVVFGLRDDREARAQALDLAARDALATVQRVAAALGVRLGAPQQVQIVDAGTVELGGMRKAAEATPIMPGQLDVRARVRAVYATR